MGEGGQIVNDSESGAPSASGPPPPPPGQGHTDLPSGSDRPRPPQTGRVDIVPKGAARGSGVAGRTIAFAVAGVLVVGMLGWGGVSLLGSEEDAEPNPGPAAPVVSVDDKKKDRLIARGDTLCKRATAAQERLLYPGTPAEFGPYLQKVRGILVGLVKDLKSLPEPKQDRRLLKRMFAKVEQLPPVLSDARAAAIAGDYQGLQRIIARGEKIEHQANALALQYGFTECSQP